MKRTLLLISLFFIFSLGSISANETNSEKTKQIQFENSIEKSSIENPGETPGGCSIDYDVVTVTNPIGCATNESGSICVTINGTSSDEFEVSINGGTTWVYDNDGNYCFEDLDARNYYLVIRDQGRCEVLYSGNPIIMTVEDEFTFTSIEATSQTHSAYGTITVNVSGTPTYYYRLDGSAWQTTNEFTGLVADTYTVDARDASGCIISEEVEILDELCPEFTLEVTEKTNCDTPNGTITVSSTAGPYPLEFSIDGEVTWQSDSVFTGLDDSNFTVYVKGSNGCVSNSSANILNNIVHTNSSLCTITDVTGCIGDATGEFDAVFEGGLPPYEYTIDGGANWQNSGTFTGLVAGDYQVKARDDFGCTNSINRTINDPTHDIINVAYTKDIIGCSGDATGIISLDAPIPAAVVTEKSANESSSKSYSIDNGTTWQESNLFENLSAGEYYAWVKHDGCEYEYEYNPVRITEPAPLSFGEVEIVLDDGSANGEIGLFGVSGGTGIIKCSIDGGVTFFSMYGFSDLAAGDYDVVIKDASDCTKDTTVTVPVDEIVYIPDAIFKAYLVGNSAINDNGDTEIQVSEAESYSSAISVADMGIADLTGIEAFVKLNSLLCRKNLLTEVDISKNIKLTSFQCNENAITALDASNNPLLRTFYAHDNQLTELVVTGCSAISSLTCGENLLTSLDVSDCTALSTFSCFENQLTELDLSNNPNLTGVTCFSNQLTSLDVRNGNNSNISTFSARTNNLTCISVSDIAFAETNWTYIDEGVSFSSDCAVAATLTVSNVNFTDVTDCYGESSGTIEILAEGGIGSITYSIDGGGLWESTGEFSGVYAGDYTIKVKDSEGNITEWASNPLTISEPDELLISDVQTVADNGTTNGEIEITATGGTGDISYSIDDGSTFQSGNVFTGLANGTYSLTIKDENDCTDESSVTVSDATLTIDEVLSTNITPCFGGSNGIITIEASGGSGSLSYSINNGSNWQSSNGFTSLTAGEYNIKVKDPDENVTTWASNPLTLTEPDELSFDVVETTNDNGTSNGTIEITASGGTGTIEYSIDNGSTFNSVNYFEGLASGTYTLVIQDENDCQAETTATINDESITISDVQTTNIIGCFSDETGTITITASGGNGSLSFSINNGNDWQSSNEFTGLPASTYYVRVKDAAENTNSWSPLSITEPDELIFDAVETTNDDNTSNGTIDITASGGTGIIEYSIDGGSNFYTDNYFEGLASGTYTLVIRDENDCQKETTATVNSDALTITEVLVGNVLGCFGDETGTITITASGGNGSLSYSIDNGSSWQSSNEFTALATGSYTVKVKDAMGTIVAWESNPVIITQPEELSFSVSKTNPVCNGESNGEIEFTNVSGGTGTIRFSIDNGVTYSTETTYSLLPAGSYILFAKDANDCVAEYESNPVELVDPPFVIVDEVVVVDDTSCDENGNGSITVTASVGYEKSAEVIDFSIDGGTTWQASSLFENLSAGSYTVWVKNSNDCIGEYESNPVVINGLTPLSFDDVQVTHDNGTTNGTIEITASGGTGTIEYSIDGGSIFNSDNYFDGLTSGTYTLVIRDENGCTAETSADVNNESITISTVSSSDVTGCFGNENGSITIDAAGGNGTLSYSVDNGDNWQASNEFSSIAEGNYTVKVKDSNENTSAWGNNPVVVEQPAEIVFSVSEVAPACNGENTGEITFMDISGGTGDLLYSIDNGITYLTEGHFTMLSAGEYLLVVKDENNCEKEYADNPVILENPQLLEIEEITAIDNSSCDENSNGSITISLVTGASGSSALKSMEEYNYSIDNGATWQTSPVFENLSGGDYFVWARNANGCLAEYELNPVTLSNPIPLVFDAIELTADNGTSNGEIDITASGGNGTIEYSIDGGSTFNSDNYFSDLASGTYTLVIKDANGCTAETTATVNDASISIDEVLSSDITTCNGDEIGTITIAATGGNGGLSYSIDNGSSWQTSGEFTSLAAGSYTVKVKDSEGNINAWTQNPVVIVSPEKLIIASINLEDDNGSSNGSILISATGGTGALSFSIDAGVVFQSINNFSDLSNGTYSILVQDENGCQATGEAIVNFVSSDASLNDIKVNGETIEGFNSTIFDYAIELSEGSIEIPKVEATANEISAEVFITQANSTSGMAEIVITAADGSQQAYTIQFSVVSGIDNIKLSAISIWPNPVTERLNVKIPVNSSVSSIALFSQTGQLIYKQPKSFYENTLIIEMSDLTTGIYTIQIVDINGNRRTEKIVKR